MSTRPPASGQGTTATAPWWRRPPFRARDREREAQALALEFAGFLSGRSDERALLKAAAPAHPDVFWTALELFADNIGGGEWQHLSHALYDLPHVRREQRRLGLASVWRRAAAARHLGLLDAPGIRMPLMRAMMRGPVLVTLTAALALARVKERGALRWLLLNPHATGSRSRYQLAALIKRFGPGAAPQLRRALREGRGESPIGLATIEALGLWKDHRSRGRLEALLLAGGTETRIAAARALGGIGDPRSGAALSEALSDASWPVRAQAARALSQLGIPVAIQRLIAAMEDPGWWVRRNAGYALATMGQPGEQALHWVRHQSRDRYAQEMAAEVLQAIEWDRESPGGISRVE